MLERKTDADVVASEVCKPALRTSSSTTRDPEYSEMGPPVRQRYNAKARQSTIGGSAHKKRRRSTVNNEDVPVGTLASEATAELDMILPGQKETERQSRLEAMRREITDQGEQLSSKKRKRLDAFIVSLKFSIVSRSTDADLL